MKRSMRQLAWQWVLMGALLMLGGATSAWAQNTFPASGNVGIGTTNPFVHLHVFSPTGGRIRVDGAAGSGFEFNDAGTRIDIPAGNMMGFYTSNVARVRIDNVGNVGIGTTNPFVHLHVFSPTGGRIRVDGAAGSGFEFNDAGTRIDIPAGNMMGFYTSNVARVRIDNVGNVGIGTTSPAAKLHVAGDAQVDGNLAAKYQDIAEWVQTPSPLPPGTVVVVDYQGRNQVLPASQSYDTRVAGVVSTRPGLLLGEAGPDKVKVAQSGRVKVKVDASYGPITVGDLLVTSPTPGYAMRSMPINLGETMIHRPGTLLGKALEPLQEGRGAVLVLLTLQ